MHDPEDETAAAILAMHSKSTRSQFCGMRIQFLPQSREGLFGCRIRIEISWWMFALAGIIAILIALITVSFQAVKAAIANPVKSLRTE